jgi:twitching motility protein PilT
MAELLDYLQRAVADGASDLFIVAGGPVSEKVERRLLPISDQRVFPEETGRLIEQIYTMAQRSPDRYDQAGDDDFSFAVPGLARFRVNTYRQRGSKAAVVRVVSFDIPDYRTLGIPEGVMDLAQVEHGMILVTGTAGSGKSTTQACIIDRINRTREGHIITLEDPIEYLHRDRKSIVSQREIAIDTQDYLSALRACLRQAPDVILLGEMRDHETIRTAMTAAETGHLLIATLHTNGAVNAIDRIIDSFPSTQQSQIRVQLSMVLHTVVSQQLVPDITGSLVPVYEIMRMTPAIRNMIRENKTHQIAGAITAGGADGMISKDQAILRLYQEGKITRQTALDHADAPEQLKRRLGGGSLI